MTLDYKRKYFTEEELNEVYAWAMNDENGGATRFAGMTYEQGIKDTIDWIQHGNTRPDLIDELDEPRIICE